MNKRKAYHVGLLMMIAITWIVSAWMALHWQTQWSLNDTAILNLSEQQAHVLESLPSPIVLEAFVSRHPRLRSSMMQAIEPVQAFVPELKVKWINPDTHPLDVQNRGITKEGQVYISVGEQGQRLEVLSPTSLAEALLAFGQSNQLMVGFTQHNGERALLSDTPGAWLRFYHHFKQTGMSIAILDTQTIPALPENIDLMVMADPKALSERAEALLANYLNDGGNLIYTTDTRTPYLAQALRQMIPLELYEGVLVDANARQFGFDNPQFQVIELLADHDITRSLQQSPLLAGAVGFNVGENDEWMVSALFWSSENSWIETDAIEQTIKMDADEMRGPIALAVIFERDIYGKQQHVIVLGDSDIWSDAYFNTGGNKALAEQIFAYFKPQTFSSKISKQPLSDQFITVSDNWLMVLAIFLLAVMPVTLMCVGWWRWRKPCI